MCIDDDDDKVLPSLLPWLALYDDEGGIKENCWELRCLIRKEEDKLSLGHGEGKKWGTPSITT